MKKFKLIITSLILGFYFVFCAVDIFVVDPVRYVQISLFASVLAGFIIEKLKKIKKVKKNPEKIKKIEIVFYAVMLVVVMVASFIWFYPCIVSYDSSVAWYFMSVKIFESWQPMLYQLIFYGLPGFFSQNIAGASIIQMLFILPIFIYFCYFLRKKGFSFIIVSIILFFLITNINIFSAFVFLLKDIPFSFAVLLLTLYLINITLTNGIWLEKKNNILAFVVASFCMLFFRHNGFAPFVCMMLFLIVAYKNYRKRLTILLVAILALYATTNKVLSIALNVRVYTGLESETELELIGVPLQQISYIYNNGGIVEESELEFMNKMSAIQNWSIFYNPTSFNNHKFRSPLEHGVVHSNKKEFFTVWFNMLKRNPRLAVESYYYVTKCFYNFKPTEFPFNSYYIESDYEAIYNYKGSFLPREIIDEKTRKFYDLQMKIIPYDFGHSLFIIIFSILVCFYKSKFNLKKFTPYVLIVANTLMAMAIVTGEEARYVFANILCCIPLLLYNFMETEDK